MGKTFLELEYALNNKHWSARFRIEILALMLGQACARGSQGGARYHFSVRNGKGNLTDDEGIELPDDAAARDYACNLARELMFQDEARKRHWWLFVHTAEWKELFSVPFVAVDETIRHLNAEIRHLIQQTSEKRLGPADAVFASRIGAMRARAAPARSSARPYLAAHNGRSLMP